MGDAIDIDIMTTSNQKFDIKVGPLLKAQCINNEECMSKILLTGYQSLQ